MLNLPGDASPSRSGRLSLTNTRSPRSPAGSPRPSSRGSNRSTGSRANDIVLTVKRVDGKDRETFKLRCNKKISIAQVKDRVYGEWGIQQHEQVIIWRGQRVNGDDRAMPLNTPDLAEIIQEAGENGLQMAVMYLPRRLPAFLENEGLEDVHGKRKTMATALHRATRKTELTVMEEILDTEFAEADAQDNAGQTALHVAVSTWNRPAVEILLRTTKFSASTAVDEEGRTALHIAASWGDATVVKMIVEHWRFKADDVNAKDCFGLTALDYAQDCGHKEAAELIAKAAKARNTSPA